MPYHSFEDLDVWKRACQLCVTVYQITSDWSERVLKDQMIRAAISIPSNIAEGAERRTTKDFRLFLSYASGSAAELRTQVYISQKIGILLKEQASSLISELKAVSAMLKKLSDSLDKSQQSKSAQV